MKALLYKIIPNNVLRKKVEIKENLHWRLIRKKVQAQIINTYKDISIADLPDGYIDVLNYLKRNKLQMLCYAFTEKYKSDKIEVFVDQENGLSYVIHNNKRLYFKRSWQQRKIREYYNNLLIEQDLESPHRYLTQDFNVLEGEVVVDAGAAEGIFALSVLELASKIYLFEPDTEWLEALDATFKPWHEKVEIISSYLGKDLSSNTITIDAYFKDKKDVHFVKVDVEGHEANVLEGTKNIIRNSPHLKIAICTYHKQDDERLLSLKLKMLGFEIKFSNGYVIFIYDENIEYPFLRKCMIRAEKKSEKL